MPLFVASINSGSNGNCYYVGNEQEAVLIDAGISCREIDKRLQRLGLSARSIKAVFISHEHSDHIRGVEVFSKKYQLPVYITPSTLYSGGLLIPPDRTFSFSPYLPVEVGNLSVTAFPKFHDASDPHSFIVSEGGVNVGVFTDIGMACDDVVRNFSQCHAVFLEANYDEEMLAQGAYPYYLKKRIQSDKGHLSNKQALELFLNHRPAGLTHVFLSHLSRDNNSPQLVQKLFDEHAGEVKVVVASRDYPSDVYCITGSLEVSEPTMPAKAQWSLF